MQHVEKLENFDLGLQFCPCRHTAMNWIGFPCKTTCTHKNITLSIQLTTNWHLYRNSLQNHSVEKQNRYEPCNLFKRYIQLCLELSEMLLQANGWVDHANMNRATFSKDAHNVQEMAYNTNASCAVQDSTKGCQRKKAPLPMSTAWLTQQM